MSINGVKMVDRTVQKPGRKQAQTGIIIIDRLQAAFPDRSFMRAAIENLESTGDIIRFLDAYSTYMGRYDEGRVYLMLDSIKEAVYEVAASTPRDNGVVQGRCVKWLKVMYDAEKSEYTR